MARHVATASYGSVSSMALCTVLRPAGQVGTTLPRCRLQPAYESLAARDISVASGCSFPAELPDVSLDGSLGVAPRVEGARQDLLWRQFFLDTALCWDIRHHKSNRNPRSRDFRHKLSKEVLWLNCVWKPDWVDAQLASLDSHAASPSMATVSTDAGNTSNAGQLSEAVDSLDSLVRGGSRVSASFCYSVLRRCVAQKHVLLGQRVHGLIVRAGYESNTFLSNHLIRMYAAQGRLQQAMSVFSRVLKPDAFTWSAIISAYARHGEAQVAIQLYKQMRCSIVLPDCHVFVAALQACAIAADLESGREVHKDVLESRVEPDLFIWNCLVDMYAKCSKLEDARRVFDSLPMKDVVTWTAMIAGYVEHDLCGEAVSLYEEMGQQGMIVPNCATFACLLKACTGVGALAQGKHLHSQIVGRGLETDRVLGTCLVNMYAKCGRLAEARTVFDSLPTKDVITWNAMINGYGQCNEGKKALECFQDMVQNCVQPDETTLTCLLVACSHEGLVKEGQQLFKAMVEEWGITPSTEHYNCMVDLLGRAGHLDEAEEVLSLCGSDFVGVMSLLNACKTHGDVERGIRWFHCLVRSDSQTAAAFVLMANIYADAGRWSDVERIENLRTSSRAAKKPAVAGIEVDRHVHTFVVGEGRADICSKVRSTSMRLKEEGGHLPRIELVLKGVSETEKEAELCGHAEKLALAYGLLHTPDGTPLLVIKNLRMCTDCHSSTEILSRVEKREIVVRDARRVHCFVDGSCRCGGRP